MNDVESLYTTENFVSSGFDKVIEWLTKTAEQGNDSAQLGLGECYANGYGVPQNWYKAVEWYTRSAEQGNAIAMDMLKLCYENDHGTPKD